MSVVSSLLKGALVLGLVLPGAACSDTTEPEPGDIIEVATAAGSFNTLATALGAAGLVDDLKGPGPFTVFAPTDEAFAKLPAGTVDALLQNIPALTNVLTFHVVSGSLPASEVVKLTSATMLNGQTVTIQVQNGEVRINGVRVVTTDVLASNGVIHVIDEVLLPN